MIKLIKKYDITAYIEYDDLLNYIKNCNKSFIDIEDAANNFLKDKNQFKLDEKKINSNLQIDDNSKKIEELNFYLKIGNYNL